MLSTAVVTFASIAAILSHNCVPCHCPGGPGPFSLISGQDAHAHAHQIEAVTRSRYMPPWLADSSGGPFLDVHKLTSAEIQIIADWVHAGAPASGQNIVVPSRPSDLGQPDLILRAEKPFRLPADGADVFWNFVFRPALASGRYVRAITIEPGNARLVHHANLVIDRTGASLRLERTPGAGFAGMDLPFGRNPLDPVSHFLFWKPGSLPYAEEPGFSWRLNPGNFLVLNTHLQPSGKPELVCPKVALYFTDQPPIHFPLIVGLQADDQLNIPPGIRDFVVRDSMTLPADSELLAIYPHAHYLGTLLVATALFPDGESRELVRISHWDLKWQAVYRFQKPLRLPKGTRIEMTYHYDNSTENPRNPSHPPRRVRAGNNASDEMAHLSLQILPAGNGDRRRIFQEAMARHQLSKNPSDAEAHLTLGAILLSRLDAQKAITELREAVRLNKALPQGHDMLGAALQNVGALQEAEAEYRAALKLQPDYASARYNLARALAKTGQRGEAVKQLELVRRAFPNDARIQSEYRALTQQSQ